MKNTVINFDFSFFMDLVKYILIPVFIVVVVTGIAIYFYSKSIKEKDIKRYNYVVNFWTCMLAIVIIGALLAITIGFSKSIRNSMIAYDLVESNNTFYYIVMVLPLFPALFLLLYIVKFIKVVLNKAERPKELEKELRKKQEEKRREEQMVKKKEMEKKEKEPIKKEVKSKEKPNQDILPPPNIVEKKENGSIEELF